MTAIDEFFAVNNPVVDPLWTEVADVVRRKAAVHPRSLQRALGPSQIADPCMRKMAYGLMDVTPSNPPWDPLPSILGIAGHKWMEGAFELENERLGYQRWLIETRVEVIPGLSGTADLYDTETGSVLDHKFLGYSSFDTHVRNPGATYRGQVQLYGRGFRNLGYDVQRVIIAMFPRSGTLTKMHFDIQDYDDAKVDRILARREAVIGMIDDFDLDQHPERYEMIPKTPKSCVFCSWFRTTPSSPLQCNGTVN